MEDEEYNEDKACEYTQKMWLKLAHRLCDDAILSSDPMHAIKCAMAADACFWQATGIIDPISIKEFICKEIA